jgi:two-component system, NtrC family, response regulator GlrR
MQRAIDLLERVSLCDCTVLLQGESGTGKELAARSLHEASARAGGPFVTVDCGKLPASLIESELFGHERGAFTGAVSARSGAFERAHRGTLFLDEIGEIPLDLVPHGLARTGARAGPESSRARRSLAQDGLPDLASALQSSRRVRRG